MMKRNLKNISAFTKELRYQDYRFILFVSLSPQDLQSQLQDPAVLELLNELTSIKEVNSVSFVNDPFVSESYQDAQL